MAAGNGQTATPYGGLLQGSFATTVKNPAPSPTGSLLDQFGKALVPSNDPAWQQPTDPLKGGNVKASALAVAREIPAVTLQTGWSVSQVRDAMDSLAIGLFDAPASLCDAIIADDRVQATLGSRTGGLLGRPVMHRLPDALKDSSAAKECLDAWAAHWPHLAAEPEVSELERWSIFLGFSPSQLMWDTTGDVWKPYLYPFYPRYTYYHWTLRHYIAITLDGQVPITPGDGHWVIHAPHGKYRGWLRGAIRAVAEPWLRKNFAWRDAARWSERHGMPIILAKTPAAADPAQVSQFRASLANMAQETVVNVPQGVDAQFSYGLEILEASSQSWQGFGSIIRESDMQIVLAIMFQNLTTEVKEGSFAAARVHSDVRQSALEADNRALSMTFYNQVARPFAAINFGDADLAPFTSWEVEPYEDKLAQSEVFDKFATAIYALRRAGKDVTNLEALAKDFGLRMALADIVEKEPLAGGGMGGGQ